MSDGMVVAHGDRFAVNLGSAERAMVTRLLGELRALLTDTTDTSAQRALSRLFPVVHPESAELEEEYQRLMRDELIASRVAGIERVEELIGNGAPTVDDEPDGALLLDAFPPARLWFAEIAAAVERHGASRGAEVPA